MDKLVIAGLLGAVILIIILFIGVPQLHQPGTNSSSQKVAPQVSPVYPITSPVYTTLPFTQNQIPLTSAAPAAFNKPNVIHIANPDIDIAISCPGDWRIDETGVMVLRDYGRNVHNIAILSSPYITSDRISTASSNPDIQRYTSLAVDVEPDVTTDFERYFNLATLAVQSRYENVEITKRDVLLKISVTDTFSGYKSYELDFDAKDVRGKYIFTNVDGTVYIFAYRNPSPYSREVEEIYKSIRITPTK